MKKFLSIVLSLAMILSTMSTVVFADAEYPTENWIDFADTSWYSEGATEFTIDTAEKLAGLAKLVNEGTAFHNEAYEDMTVTLGANIDLSGKMWTPIGNAGGDRGKENGYYPFMGTFEGNYKIVSNVVVYDENTPNLGYANIGLFGSIGKYGDAPTTTVRNLTVNNAIVKSSHTTSPLGSNVAAVIGNANASTVVENVHLTGNIEIEGWSFIGGIVGHGYPEMTNCSVEAEGTIKAYQWCCGALVGYLGEGADVVDSSVKGAGETGLNLWSGMAGIGGAVGRTNGGSTVENITVENISIETTRWYADNYGVGYVASGADTATDSNVGGVVVKVEDGAYVPKDAEAVKMVVAKVDGEYFTDMAAAVKAIANDSNVVIFAGTYNNALSISKNNVTVTANGDVTFTAAPSIKGKNYHVEGINFEYDNGETNLGGSGLIENCNFTAGNNTFRYCYAGEGTIEFNGCTLNATNWAIHFDSAPGLNLVLVDSSITGRIALGSDLNSFSATGTDFNGSYINIWGTVDGAAFDECEFNDIPYIFTGYDKDNTVEFTDCTTDDGSSIADLIYGDIEDTNTTIIVDGASKTKAAKIGDVYYKTLAEALDAIGTTAGDYTINLIADSDEDVIIHQAEGVNITILGRDDVKYTGTMDIYGHSRYTGAETLTIDGIYFDGSAKTADDNFIRSDFRHEECANDPQNVVRYAHNVTVQNCRFEGSDNAAITALRFRQAYNVVIKECTANNVHSVMWGTGIGGDGVTVDKLTANCTNGGISVGGATPSTVITNSDITVTGEYGYGVRSEANGDYDLAINNTTINAFTPVLLRKATSSDYTMTSTDNTFTASNPMGMDVVTTKTDYDEENTDIVAPDVEINLNLGNADEIEVVFEKVAEDDEASDLYNINLVGANAEIINRLNSGDLTFVFDPEDGKDVDFEILDADKNDHITIAPVDNSKYRYEFHFDTKANVADTANTITIAQVKFEGYGKFSFKVKEDAVDANNKPSNVVHATKLSDNIVDTFVVGGKNAGKGELIINNAAENTDNDDEYGYIDDAEITVPTRELTINITFPNAVENNVKAYQDMTVTIVGEKVDITRELGTDGYAYKFTEKLPYNTPYTVTVKGAGYRTARYTVTLNENKTLNFWNNVKDIENAKAIEDKGTVKVTKNFLAGDIVKDNNINIYDLSAVVSYFNTTNDTSAYSDYAKYDLNRDGVINSKDVAYVLVSWGE